MVSISRLKKLEKHIINDEIEAFVFIKKNDEYYLYGSDEQYTLEEIKELSNKGNQVITMVKAEG